jgi:lambda repressor-like predicted transcriptional regulator
MANRVHPEDIKSAIRKQFRSIAAFERYYGLPERSVKDVMRGRSRPKVAHAIANVLGVSVQDIAPTRQN